MAYFEDFVVGAGEDFTPIKALLAGVLQVALRDFARRGNGVQVQRNRSNARRWLFGTPVTGSGLDFEPVCDSLNLEPQMVRRLALAGRVRLSPLADLEVPRRRSIESVTRTCTEMRRSRDEIFGTVLLRAKSRRAG